MVQNHGMYCTSTLSGIIMENIEKQQYWDRGGMQEDGRG